MPKYSCVYVATNSVNGKQYVGVTMRYLCHRKYTHFRMALKGNSQSAFHRALRKYGKEAFTFALLGKFDTFDEAKRQEINFISMLRPAYNMTKGGDGSVGYRHTQEERKRISERNKGRPGPWRGKGIPPGFLVRDDLWRARIGAAHRGRKMSAEKVASMMEKRGNKAGFKGIACLNDGKEFPSAAEAARYYGVQSNVVLNICKRRQHYHSAKGLVFRYVGELHGGAQEAAEVVAAAKLSQRSKLCPSYYKGVVRSTDGVIYGSVKDAAIANGVSQSTVIKSCKNKYRYASRWRDAFQYDPEVRM